MIRARLLVFPMDSMTPLPSQSKLPTLASDECKAGVELLYTQTL